MIMLGDSVKKNFFTRNFVPAAQRLPVAGKNGDE